MPESNGKRFIEKLIAASPTARRKFTVLGQDIYVSPLTRKAMTEAMPKDGISRAPDYEGLFMIVHCAEDLDGSKLFEVKDIDALRECVSLDLLQQIESGMLGALAPDEKEVEEVVKADPLSASA